MRRNGRSYRLAVFAVLVSTANASWSDDTSAGTSIEMTLNNPRPVFALVVELERRLQVVISYEDPMMTYDGDLKDAEEDSGRTHKDGTPRMRLMRGGQLHIKYSTELEADPQKRINVIDECLRQASAAGYEFSVRQVGARTFHVYPSRVRDATGTERQYTPLLDTLVTIPARTRTSMEFLTEVLAQVARVRGVRMQFGNGPIHVLTTEKMSDGATHVRASELVKEALGEKAPWMLQCFPDDACAVVVVPPGRLPSFLLGR